MIEDVLYTREQLFICPPPGTSRAAVEGLLAEDFIEVGASGGTCDRASAIEILTQRTAMPCAESWNSKGFAVRRITEDCYLTLYILHQPARVTRRATIWRLEGDAWRAVYHQGTRI